MVKSVFKAYLCDSLCVHSADLRVTFFAVVVDTENGAGWGMGACLANTTHKHKINCIIKLKLFKVLM